MWHRGDQSVTKPPAGAGADGMWRLSRRYPFPTYAGCPAARGGHPQGHTLRCMSVNGEGGGHRQGRHTLISHAVFHWVYNLYFCKHRSLVLQSGTAKLDAAFPLPASSNSEKSGSCFIHLISIKTSQFPFPPLPHCNILSLGTEMPLLSSLVRQYLLTI